MRTLKNIGIAVALTTLLVAAAFSCAGKSGKLALIEVTPSAAVMTEGNTQQLIATAVFSDGSSLNWTSAATWISSDPSVATVSNSIGTFGLVTATSFTTGTITIEARDVVNGVSGIATLFVTHTPLIAIQVTPINELVSLVSGTIVKYRAEGIYADGPPLDLTNLITWHSSNTHVATISNDTGSKGTVRVLAAGVTTIKATDPASHITGETQLIVQP